MIVDNCKRWRHYEIFGSRYVPVYFVLSLCFIKIKKNLRPLNVKLLITVVCCKSQCDVKWAMPVWGGREVRHHWQSPGVPWSPGPSTTDPLTGGRRPEPADSELLRSVRWLRIEWNYFILISAGKPNQLLFQEWRLDSKGSHGHTQSRLSSLPPFKLSVEILKERGYSPVLLFHRFTHKKIFKNQIKASFLTDFLSLRDPLWLPRMDSVM